MEFLLGDCVEVLLRLPASSVDVVICDPPYALSRGRTWDKTDVPGGIAPSVGGMDYKVGATGRAHSHGLATYDPVEYQRWCCAWGVEVKRVMKPGELMLVCGGPRTYARMAVGLEDAGFVILDTFIWLFGHGYPKGLHNLGKYLGDSWEGWATTLRPAWEPLLLVRAPFRGTLTQTAREYGTGGINVGEGRWPTNTFIEAAVGGLPRALYSHKAGGEERWGWCHDCGIPVQWPEHKGHNPTWHPSVKPLGLIRHFVELFVRPGACLLDPFAGTGTVAVAASGVTSNVISIEIDETYLRIAEARTVAAGAGEDVTSLVGQLFEQGG
jgi:site-specific DNA-methyltransferase (adenine-specific)